MNPDVPYKTLLLSVSDSAAHVVRETLEKYGMDKENPDAFCLVEVWYFLSFQSFMLELSVLNLTI